MTMPLALVWDLIAVDKASGTFTRVAGSAEKAAVSTKKAEAGVLSFAKKASTALLVGAGVAIDQAVKFQKSMTLIQTAGGETAKKAEAISKGILQTATATGTSLSALSDGIYTVAKAGSQKWSATGQLQVLKAAAQGAKAENVDLGTAVNALTSVMMSYHLGTSQAVATENELIIGAGKAKTSMQDYAASLATVVPVASAAGISFAQIAGAIATLTQHGTSAAEATQELANTIRNLQAPNNVAISAMNQLGISSLDISRNLGKRGLTGTLQVIEQHLPKTGLVYLSAMKQMEAGTADLNTMLSKMSPNLASVSKQFLDGSLPLTTYRKDFRGMGAEGAAQGQQFLSLAQKVKGYNDSVRNGTPAQKTMAAELKAIFGGAVGLNTALQLGGENMAYFKTATEAVGKAALNAGSDVLGWNKTQDTLAVKMDKAKASLQVLAVEIGTALIPAVSKIVGWLQKAIQWFQGLSHTDKEIIGWSAGIIAAFGPLLAIGTRLYKMFLLFKTVTLFGSTLFVNLLKGEGVLGSVRTAYTRVAATAATTAEEVAAAEAAQTRAVVANVETQMAALAELRAGMAGAIPVRGAVMPIGGAAGAAEEGAATGGALAAVRGGASKLAGRALVGAGIYYGGHLIGDKVGGKGGQIISDAATGAAIGSLVGPEGAVLGAGLGAAFGAAKGGGTLGPAKDVKTLQAALKEGRDRPSWVRTELQQIVKSGGSLHSVASQAANLVALTKNVPDVQKAAAQAMKAAASAQYNFNDAMSLGSVLVRANGKSLDANTAAGKMNRQWLTQQIGSLNEVAAEQRKAGVATSTITDKFKANEAAVRKAAIAAGFNKDQVDALIKKDAHLPPAIQAIIDKYGRIPGQKNTTVTVNDQATEKIRHIAASLSTLHGRTVYISEITISSTRGLSTQGSAGVITRAKAAGGSLSDGWFTVGERGWELGRKLGSKVEIYSNPVSKAMTGWNNVPGFADGTQSSKMQPAVYVQNPFTGEYLLARVAGVADQRMAVEARRGQLQGARGPGGW